MLSKFKGFTLIELLVVIAIIGVLATIVLVSLDSARARARDSRRLVDIHNLQVGLQMYSEANNNNYPPALSDLVTVKFIGVLPVDPLGGSAYQYCVSAAKGYHLGTRAAGLEISNNPALNSDADAVAGDCAAGGFSGADPVYDVTP